MNEKNYKKHMTVWIIITIVLVGISFYGGDVHGQNAAKAASLAARGQFGQGGSGTARGRFAAGGGVVSGSVLAKDDMSITVKGRDGSTKIVLYSGSTQVLKSTSGTPDDLSVGSQVSVIGTQNTDGSVTAQSIQIRPTMPTTPTQAPTTPTQSGQ